MLSIKREASKHASKQATRRLGIQLQDDFLNMIA
jgi:hypothetical protein